MMQPLKFLNRFGLMKNIRNLSKYSSHELLSKSDFKDSFSKDVLGNKTITALGYGPQGLSQSMNLKIMVLMLF